MEISFFMSADVFNDLCIGLAMKNYLKMTPHIFKSGKWIKSYGKFNFHFGNENVMKIYKLSQELSNF